jgi:hypothetical protein
LGFHPPAFTTGCVSGLQQPMDAPPFNALFL